MPRPRLLFALLLPVALLHATATEATPAASIELKEKKPCAEGYCAPRGDGSQAVLTLKPEFQRKSQRLLRRAGAVAGAVVMLQVSTGKVLVWASSKKRGYKGPDVLYVQAPAASLFKIVTTAALLEATPITIFDRICAEEAKHAILRRHLEPTRDPHALCDKFKNALGHSRNAVYAQLATQHLLRTDLIDMAERLGFNQDVPFDVPLRGGSLVVPYNDLEFARTAAGFRGNTLSPLGAAQLGLTIATRGERSQIRIVERAGQHQAAERRTVLGRSLRKVTANRISRMMEVTVHSGTALAAFTNDHHTSYLGAIRVAAKTGTLRPSPKQPLTSWFVAFAPSRSPEIVVSVLLQNGRIWQQQAKELGRDVLRLYFAGRARGVTSPL